MSITDSSTAASARRPQHIRGPVLTQQKHTHLAFEALSEGTVQAAIELANKAFPDDRYNLESPETEYLATLHPDQYHKALSRLGLVSQKHWVVRSPLGEIVGLTGLQRKITDEPHQCWLGWFCVTGHARGLGIGKRVLTWTMLSARDMGFREMRLWTTNAPSEVRAQALYEQLGFLIYGVEHDCGTGRVRLYRKRLL